MAFSPNQDGEVVYVDWMPQKDQDTGKIQSKKSYYLLCLSLLKGVGAFKSACIFLFLFLSTSRALNIERVLLSLVWMGKRSFTFLNSFQPNWNSRFIFWGGRLLTIDLMPWLNLHSFFLLNRNALILSLEILVLVFFWKKKW